MTYYQVLEISETATQEEIMAAFRKAAKKYHPDLNHSDNAKEMFVLAYEAYDILKDSEKRRIYDAKLRASRTQTQTGSQYYANSGGFQSSAQHKTTEDSNKKYQQYRAQAREKAEEYAKKDYQSFSDEFWGVVKKVAKGTADAVVGAAEGVAIGMAQGCLSSLFKFGIIAVIMLVILGVITCQTSSEQHQREKQFAGIYSELGKGQYYDEYTYKPESYSFSGKKVLIVDMDRQDIYNKFWHIDTKHQAQNDDEIDYLLQVDIDYVVVGHYTDGASAFRNDYTLRVIDYHKKVTVDIISGQGNQPPKTKSVSGNVGGGNDLDRKLTSWFGSQSK
jgi:curved DNA-binding protein CbpA